MLPRSPSRSYGTSTSETRVCTPRWADDLETWFHSVGNWALLEKPSPIHSFIARAKREYIICNKPRQAIIDNMISLKSATDIARELARRVRERRLRRGWTQAELAKRAGVMPSTYILFERTGRIAVIRLLKILDVLELANEFDHIGRQEDLTGMTLAQITQPERKRGTRKRV
jgi:DNA-binding XRE family transcriptional regulator